MGGDAAVPTRHEILALMAAMAPDGTGGPVSEGTLLADVGFDSLWYAELATAVEDAWGLDLGSLPPTRCQTAADVVALVQEAATRDGNAPSADGLGRLQAGANRVVGGLVGRWFDLEVNGAEHVPATGPVVLCMNHESLLDIPLVVAASPRPITFMAKRELFRKAAASRFFHTFGAFSVDREAFDLRAVELALDVVHRGLVLGMYPEGTRTPGSLLSFLPGAPWIALKTGAPLVPCGIAGTDRAMPPGSKVPRRTPVEVTFLPPIAVTRIEVPTQRRAAAERLALDLRTKIAPLVGYENDAETSAEPR